MHSHTHTHTHTHIWLTSRLSSPPGHALKSHYTIHKDEKPYMCQECGDIFSRSQYLQKHMKTHDHTKSYLCQYCPATFRTHESLRYHTESHLGDKTYQCEECMMTFHRKDHYKVHKFRIHRNIKYTCDMCEAVYSRSDHLKRHKRKAHPCGVWTNRHGRWSGASGDVKDELLHLSYHWSKTHKRLKERILIRRNRTKRANLRGNPLCQAMYINTTENS